MEGKRPAIHSILKRHHTRALGHCLSRLLESQVGIRLSNMLMAICSSTPILPARDGEIGLGGEDDPVVVCVAAERLTYVSDQGSADLIGQRSD
jgi:hypothetical protein